ncbi:dTMP kinase [Patescibacteria group bacterium]|nr:dTMP kinase [Patescibacteria group bacterium]
MKKGKFIVLDGIDGCGKGTILKKIASYLVNKNKMSHVLLTREPYISEHNAEIRRMMKENANPYDNAEIFADLFVKDRKVHADWIQKELVAGHHVVCDRYKYSTLAYQQTQGISLIKLIEMHKGVLIPDLAIIVDVPVEEAIRRANKDKNRNFKEVFEKQEFQEKLRTNYLAFPKAFPKENIVVLTGVSSDIIFEKSKIEIDKILNESHT